MSGKVLIAIEWLLYHVDNILAPLSKYNKLPFHSTSNELNMVCARVENLKTGFSYNAITSFMHVNLFPCIDEQVALDASDLAKDFNSTLN